MGRPKTERVWKHFRTGDSKSVQCNYCDQKFKVANVNRMHKHLIKCFKCPEIIRTEMKETNSTSKRVPLQTNSENVPPVGDQSCDRTNDAPSKISDYSNMSETLNMPSTSFSSSADQSSLIEKLARAIIVSGAPLSLVEHPLWIEFFRDLQPSFKLPSRKALTTKYLNKIYNEMKKEVKEELDTVNYMHLQLDGWSNINNEGVINFIISKPEPFFVESINTEQNRHTSEYLREEILKVMRTYGEEKFLVVIGDNAKNIQKAFRLVKEVHPHIVPLNCAAHTINLLARDALKCDGFKNFIKLCTDVIKHIKKSQVLGSQLRQIVKQKKSGEQLKLPCCTRFGSYLISLRSLKNTKAALLALAIEENTVMSNETKAALLDDNFWNYLEQCISVLEPITEPIFQLESNKCNVHSVFMVFKDMKSRMSFILPSITILENAAKNEILSAVAKRMEDCVKPLHLSAYLLDPKTRGIQLNQDEELEAMNFIYEMARVLNVDVMPELAAYKAKEGFWRKPFIWQNVNEINPLTWWKGLCSSTKLYKVAVRILSAPCTSAATERSFSAHANIHTKKRNRLTTENAAKITFIKYNWNIFNKIKDSEDSDDNDIDVLSPCPEQTDSDEESVDSSESRSEFQFINIICNNDEQGSDSDNSL